MLWNTKNGTLSIEDTTMQYVSFGYGKKALLLLPGLSDGLTTVKGKALLLASSYQLFSKEYRVYIFSRKDEMKAPYSIQDMADDQAKAMKLLGVESASVMGVSEGGMIAQSLAIRHPHLVDRLVLAVTTSRTSESTKTIVEAWMEYAKQGKHKELMLDTAYKSYSDGYLKRYRMVLPLLGILGNPRDYSRFLINAEAILHFDCTNELENIKCPTLIIGGTADQIVGPDSSFELHRHIAKSQIYMYNEFGHALYEEQKDDFDKRVYDFLTHS